jgi:hypothetical protein
MERCSICLEEINNVSITNCNHSFCSNCLNGWLDQNKDTCPMCRTKIRSYINNEEITKIISINTITNNENIPMNEMFIRSLIIRHAKLKCLLYSMAFGFAYTISTLLTYNYDNMYLNNELESCEYNLTQLEIQNNEESNIYNNILMYDETTNKMRQCMISEYFYNKCFS